MRKDMKRKSKKTVPAKETNGTADNLAETDANIENENPSNENGEPSLKKRRSDKQTKTPKGKENAADETNYEVEAVLDEKMIKGVKHYLIRWKGYESESDTWEPESTVNCKELIKKYHDNKKTKKPMKRSASPKKAAAKSSPKKAKTGKAAGWDENQEFEVSKILEVTTKKNGKREFLVSWKGYPESQNTWEPEENMACKDLIEKFLATEKKTSAKPAPSPRTSRSTKRTSTNAKSRKTSNKSKAK